jgi:hypothetical protein
LLAKSFQQTSSSIEWRHELRWQHMQSHPAADKNSTSLYNAQNMVTAAIEKSRHVREAGETLRSFPPQHTSVSSL